MFCDYFENQIMIIAKQIIALILFLNSNYYAITNLTPMKATKPHFLNHRCGMKLIGQVKLDAKECID